jgi:toxin FitB
MAVHGMASQELGENPDRAKDVARNGQQSLRDSISHWDGGAFDFDPPKADLELKAGRIRSAYLLDTNVVSEFRRPSRTHPDARHRATRLPGGDLYVPVVTIFELEYGAELEKRRDPAQGGVRHRWIESEVVRRLRNRTVEVDRDIARRAAALPVPDPRPDRDAFIAATALVHGPTVVTRNVRDLAALGVPLLNPRDAGAP